jgi:hypothetical protein
MGVMSVIMGVMSVITAVIVAVVVLFAISGFVGAFQVIFRQVGAPTARSLVAAPDGTEYLVLVRKGPGRGGRHSSNPVVLGTLWAVIRRDRSWWVNVETARPVPRAVLRERFATEREATTRSAELVGQIKMGSEGSTWHG